MVPVCFQHETCCLNFCDALFTVSCTFRLTWWRWLLCMFFQTYVPSIGFTRCHHVWPHDPKLWRVPCSFYLPCSCFPPFPLVTLLILLPPSKVLKVSDAQGSRRDWSGSRAEKGSGVILPGKQRWEVSNRKVGEVEWWKWVPGSYRKVRDWYDSRLKGLGLLRLESWERYQDGKEGCCILTISAAAHLFSVKMQPPSFPSWYHSQLLFSRCLFAQLFFPLLKGIGNGRAPESEEGVSE